MRVWPHYSCFVPFVIKQVSLCNFWFYGIDRLNSFAKFLQYFLGRFYSISTVWILINCLFADCKCAVIHEQMASILKSPIWKTKRIQFMPLPQNQLLSSLVRIPARFSGLIALYKMICFLNFTVVSSKPSLNHYVFVAIHFTITRIRLRLFNAVLISK